MDAAEGPDALASNIKQHVVAAERRSSDGKLISEGAVITAEAYATAAKGMLEEAPTVTLGYRGCFAAGTLVHTAEGSIPIEKIRVGAQVLSQPERGGERASRRVVKKVTHLDQSLMAVQIRSSSDEGSQLTTIFATPNHPFWVEAPVVECDEGLEHWLAAECLEPGMTVQLADGRGAEVRLAAFIQCTQHADIFFAGDEQADAAQVLCLANGVLEVASPERLRRLGKLELGERYLAPVYNFEVDEFHTYYVGDEGVWVHNTNCPRDQAFNALVKEAALEQVCFAGDTPVLWDDSGAFIEIERVKVGSIVISRCEQTGEIAPKRVLKIHESYAQYYAISCKYGPAHQKEFHRSEGYLYATGEHPVWVENKGWTPVRELQPGHAFLTYNGDPTTVEYVLTPEDFAEQRGARYAYDAVVYNLEVEDCNTYFVCTAGIWVHNCNTTICGSESARLLVTSSGTAPHPAPTLAPS